VVTGNLARQPVLRHMPHRIAGKLVNADFIHDRGLMIGIHPNTTDAQVAHVIAVVQKLVKGVQSPARNAGSA
jgi:CDP-6-deoxy-D-xylo-4-hexulose-3-dehydrase